MDWKPCENHMNPELCQPTVIDLTCSVWVAELYVCLSRLVEARKSSAGNGGQLTKHLQWNPRNRRYRITTNTRVAEPGDEQSPNTGVRGDPGSPRYRMRAVRGGLRRGRCRGLLKGRRFGGNCRWTVMRMRRTASPRPREDNCSGHREGARGKKGNQ